MIPNESVERNYELIKKGTAREVSKRTESTLPRSVKRGEAERDVAHTRDVAHAWKMKNPNVLSCIVGLPKRANDYHLWNEGCR